ncbi:MAG: PDZ domain-containing protein, partial [Acidobacteriota bacterium]|nr:PDZ domain-containing protein [Acidobacteriota bacterium]
IVYECGGYLYRFDPAAGASTRVPIRVMGDLRGTLPRLEDVSSNVAWLDLSPSGKRALLTARGDVFSVPAEKGEIRNLTRSQGVAERYASWSPDGRWVAYLGDRTGEYEIYIRAQDGSGEERAITTGAEVWRFPPAWSPDGTKLAFGDRDQRLRYVQVEGGRVIDVDQSPHGDITSYAWSPDSRWLVYTKDEPSQFSSIFVHSLDDAKNLRLSGEETNDYSPVFDPAGRYLYFLSDRDWNLTFSGYEFNYLYTKPTRVYAATLGKDGPALLVPESDEEEAGGGVSEGKKKKKDKKEKPAGDEEEKEPPEVVIDVEHFADRVVALPVSSESYRSLSATKDAALFLSGSGPDTKLQAFMLDGEKVETIIEGINAYVVSESGKKVLYAKGEAVGIVDLKPKQEASEGRLDLAGLQMEIDPRLEWRQIFADAWRITRDWFYDPGLHGLDWKAMRELYEPLVDHVAHRGDLDYILGEMGAELGAGHYYVNWGDMPRPKRIDGGLLGAEVVAADGHFRIEKIFPGENWHDQFRVPLTAAGVDVSEGDFILAVDGVSTSGVKNFYSLLQGKAGRAVTLLVNDRPSTNGTREETVRPIARETNVRYLDWVRSRRERVDRLSGGRIGYIHLPNTAADGNRELRKQFYPQARKEALIFDVRYNGGGFIPDRMIELLARTKLSFWKRRGTEPNQTPGFAHAGPKVCLINGYSSSGGDAFPYYFRKLGLGPLIGSRTWGGLIGISGNPGFVDGGSINVPTFRFLDTDGNWAVENEG